MPGLLSNSDTSDTEDSMPALISDSESSSNEDEPIYYAFNDSNNDDSNTTDNLNYYTCIGGNAVQLTKLRNPHLATENARCSQGNGDRCI